MDDDRLLAVFAETASAVRAALDELGDWGPAGTKPGQHHADIAADRAALEVLSRTGATLLSEESGVHEGGQGVVIVVDPVDGSTNAWRGVPWYATSLCALDAHGPRVALVVNQATGTRFEAVRGGGATCDGHPIAPSRCDRISDSVLGLSGYPARHLGWRQFRAFGAAALDLCAVASGVLDGWADCVQDGHGPWDYLGGLLVCREAGAVVEDLDGRDLELGTAQRRTPIAAATPQLLSELRDRLLADTRPKKKR